MTTREKNISKLKISNGTNCYWLHLGNFKYKLSKDWKSELTLNIENENFKPEWLLNGNQLFRYQLDLIQSKKLV